MWIDTHAHLYADQFGEDRHEMINRAIDAQVTRMLLPNIDIDSIEGMHELEDRFPTNCHSMMGLHPCHVKEDYKEQLEVITDWLEKRSYVGIGEAGIDLYWDTTFKKQQIEAFEYQIELALKYDIPIIIHSREALDLTIDITTSMQNGNLKALFHCFNGTREQAKILMDNNFHMGLGGVITYKNSNLDNMVQYAHMDHIVLETDAPYLSPTPYRGKRNESSYIPHVAQKLSDIKSWSLLQTAEITSRNARLLFKLETHAKESH